MGNVNKVDKSKFFDTKEKISRWLDKYNIENYTINDDLSVDVDDSVNISGKNLITIPVKFGTVTGNFRCQHNKLTNLIGSPKTVGGDFDCSYNQIINLTGSTEVIGGSFYCSDNQLATLAGSPKSVSGSFWCYNNPLISLLEFVNCKFKETLYLEIDKKNFKQKEIIPALKKYYHKKHKGYILSKSEFHDIIKSIVGMEFVVEEIKKTLSLKI